jgi:antirestriction protein ArdC
MIGLVTSQNKEKKLTNKETPTKKKKTKSSIKKTIQKLKTSDILKGLFVSSLDGWKDDKEKFKTELINDIKSFLFGKWEKPWKAGLIFDEDGKVLSGFRNISGRLYKNSSNILAMERNSGKSPFFITIDALISLGGKLIDKTKVLSVLSYIPMFKDKENKTPRKPDWMLPKLHSVVNVDYCDGIKKPKIKELAFINHELNEYVENFLKELIKKKRVPKIYHDQADQCHYKHTSFSYDKESIHMVDFKQFRQIDSYYSVLFHEIVHSTENPKRLGRGNLGVKKTLKYANEELVAEIGAMIISTELGLKYNRQNGLVYLKSWLKNTTGDVDENLLEAYGYACDAADYILKGIDLSKLVPKSMTERAKETPEPKPTKKQTLKKEKEPGTSKVKKTRPSKKEQLSLFGLSGKKVISLDNWKPNTHIIPLKTDLGKFIGGYERNHFAIVFRGEKGAGKTRLLCQAINLFASEGLNCLFKSLEVSPESELFGSYTNYIESKNKDHVFVDADTSLKVLEEQCKTYDCIAIDSWGKLGGIDQGDFGRLVEKYPKVIWLVIFQSTTSGTARGGSMSEYDSSLVVQVAKGGNAVCEKNRYNSCDLTYNVFTKKLIKDENIKK